MHVIVPRVELAEIVFRFRLVSKIAWEGGQGLDRGEVRLDVRVIIGRARSAEQLWDTEFLEVGDGRARAHLGAAVTERLGPSLSGLIQQAFVDQTVIPQGLHLIADQLGADAPGDVFAAPMIEQTVQVQEDAWLPSMQIGDVPIPQLVGAVDPVCVGCGPIPTLDGLPPAWAIAVQRSFVLPNGHMRHIRRYGACMQGQSQFPTTGIGVFRRLDQRDDSRSLASREGIIRTGPTHSLQRGDQGGKRLDRSLPTLNGAWRQAQHFACPESLGVPPAGAFGLGSGT